MNSEITLHSTVCGKKRDICSRSHRKKFRQINFLVISLIKTLFSRNFCQRIFRENFRANFHINVPWQYALLDELYENNLPNYRERSNQKKTFQIGKNWDQMLDSEIIKFQRHASESAKNPYPQSQSITGTESSAISRSFI